MHITIHNAETHEVIEKPLTAKEIAELEAAANKAEAERLATAAARQALLEKLGITADEAKLLLG